MKKAKKEYSSNLSDNFKLIDETFLRIAEKENKQGTRALSDPEKVVGAIWHVYGIIGNGGIPYFFEFTFDVEEVAKAYEKLGMRKSASILRKAISKFPNSRRPKDFKECMEFIDEHEEYFMTLSTRFWETQNKIEEILASYIKKQPEAFS